MKKILLVMVFIWLFPFCANAGVSCEDLKGGNYFEKMDELMKLAGLADGCSEMCFNRYHEDLIGYLCNNDGSAEENKASIKSMIDMGYVKSSEVEAIKEVLGKDNRSEAGKSYGFSRQKFSNMGLCNSCADNVAQYYTRQPDSHCGKLAKQALEGNPKAIEELQEFPSYCEWKY